MATWLTTPLRRPACTPQATAGDVTRLYSVLLEPEEMTAADNLLENGDFESGVTPWTSTDCDLETKKDKPHGGEAYLRAKNRVANWDGARQDIAANITKDTAYEMELWVSLKDYPETVWLVLWWDTTAGYYSEYFAAESVGTDWTKISGTVTATWSGSLRAVYCEIETDWTDQEFSIDDAVFIEKDVAPPVHPVEGTYRREVLP